jgi:hypothetical protein
VEYSGGGNAWPAEQKVKAPGVDARPLPAWGLYARNVETLTLEDVRFSLTSDDFRPAICADGVQRLTLDGFKFTRVPGVTQPIVTNNVGHLLQYP